MSTYKAIALCGLKGGVGKSLISINLACAYHGAGRKVLLVDADAQGTARTWAGQGAKNGHDVPPVVSLDERTIVRDLPRVAAGYDIIVVDSPARLGAEARAAMVTADLVLMPVIPGAADVWALRETIGVYEEARALRPDLVARIVLNRTDRTTLAEATSEYITKLGVEVLDEGLGSRVAFGNATLEGLGVLAYEPSSMAAEEVGKLFAAVDRLLFPRARKGSHAQDESPPPR